MNLEFNIAVHLLAFLTKHADERFNSKTLSELICINPVQLRRVTGKLIEHGYVETVRGKYGGYQANETTRSANLADLFNLFTADRSQGRLFTGNTHSDCEISREIANTMEKHRKQEYALLMNYYKTLTVEDVLHETLASV
ncbi:redox-sensitive transcriptional regulator HypR [Staphylococcus simulans]